MADIIKELAILALRKRDNVYVTQCLSSKIDEEDSENNYSYKSGSEESSTEEEENETNTELEHSVAPSRTITIALPEIAKPAQTDSEQNLLTDFVDNKATDCRQNLLCQAMSPN
ncbi:hypothetical protein EAI_03853 [Harpegnathos saltator]|uniref:Uncharacterized protein n=1 Tax=Harpegnathos saltator TaxID=610380 RepID=E2C5T2_HARSA|nr:hypothetical protein EAI_03853 [Harpegnathos saltator]